MTTDLLSPAPETNFRSNTISTSGVMEPQHNFLELDLVEAHAIYNKKGGFLSIILLKDLLIFILYMLACVYICALHDCLVLPEVRRGCQIPGDRSYRWAGAGK